MERDELKPIIETLIFAADHAISLDRLAGVIEGVERVEIKAALDELVTDYESRSSGLSIAEVAGGFQLRTRPEHAPWIKRLFKLGMQRISRAAIETMAIVAYKQPVTRAEIEEVRGVDSAGVLRTLLDRRLIKITGRKDLPGRPVVYGTTKEFLETFDLKDLSVLPTLKEIEMLEEEEPVLLGDTAAEAEIDTETNDHGAEASEDNSKGGDNIEAQGRGVDNRGQGEGQCEDGD